MAAEPAWRTKWPRTGDPKTWLRATIHKCEAIPDDDIVPAVAGGELGVDLYPIGAYRWTWEEAERRPSSDPSMNGAQ